MFSLCIIYSSFEKVAFVSKMIGNGNSKTTVSISKYLGYFIKFAILLKAYCPFCHFLFPTPY
ncbi:hypothetical protein DXX99_06080 [Ammonifex thiophilus]|uniref:Uncharacterized protein n=1 Tax=Ammonifex thiophilus TaxID=444093 RepID=A0A3D8P4C7_9THEO|nr:hypothetical protein DXX99_06080 [Ammonifex thiophilus]